MDEKYSHLPNKKTVLDQKYNQERARVEELNKSISDLKKRLKVIEEKKAVYGTELKDLKSQISTIEKTRQRLEADRQQLRTGSR
jgi:chromosome segregation ATPase